MIHFPKRALLAAMLLAGAAAAAPALAARSRPSIEIEDAWSPPPPPGAPTAAGYLTIRNAGHAPDRLLGGATPVAAQVQLHSMSTQGGVMRMRPITGGLAIAGGATVRIEPGAGLHLMLIGLKRTLRAGEHVPVTLRFAKAGDVHADLLVRAQGANAPPSGMGGHDHMNRTGGR